MNDPLDDLTDRQRRERDFHRDYAATQAKLADEFVDFDVLQPGKRRWWNAFWTMYDYILAAGLENRRVLIPGCGFGADAIRLTHLGAQVSAFDISPEIIEVAKRRAAKFAAAEIDFDVMTAEQMTYPAASFDAVLFVDVLHHVDIVATMREIRRVLKPGGLIIGDELYTHSSLQAIRDSRIVAHHLYPRMRKWIYGTDTPYITEDEHKIDETEFALVRNALKNCVVEYFGAFEGRLFPNHLAWASRLDRRVMRRSGALAARLGSRVVFRGEIDPTAIV